MVAQPLYGDAATSWRAYRAWNRACLLNAWRATRRHFGGGWRAVMEVVGPGLATTFVLYMGGADHARESVVPFATGAAISVLWIVIVLCWNLALAPYRLWRAAGVRIADLQMAIDRRNDRRAIARELELCIKQGTVLMQNATPSKGQLSRWYQGVLRVVSRAGAGHRAMLENLGPAPGTRGGALELLILGNRIQRLRAILSRQSSGRERESIGPRRIASATRRG